MTQNFNTSSYMTSSFGNDTMSTLKNLGYKVEQNNNGYSITLDTGKVLNFANWEPVWSIMAKLEEENKDGNIIEKWKNEYLELADRYSAKAKEAEELKESFHQIIKELRQKLGEIFYKTKATAINKINDQNMREEALAVDKDITDNRFKEIGAENRSFSYSLEAFCASCNASKFNYA